METLEPPVYNMMKIDSLIVVSVSIKEISNDDDHHPSSYLRCTKSRMTSPVAPQATVIISMMMVMVINDGPIPI